MTDKEHIEMMVKQCHSTTNYKIKKQLQKAIHRLDRKMKEAKTGMRRKDGIYVQQG